MSLVSDGPAMDGDTDGLRLRGRRPLRGPEDLVHGLWRRWADAGPFVAPPRSEWPRALRRAWRVGLLLLFIQLVGLFVWSSVIAHRDALTFDFAGFYQAAVLIAHGHLNPYATTVGHAWWQDHAAFIMAPVGLIEHLWPHAVTLLWLQDLVTVGSEAIAFAWVCDIAARRTQRGGTTSAAVGLAVLGIILLTCNPWMDWSASYDFHAEVFAGFFVIGAARDLYRSRKTGWIWVAIALTCGDVGASYLGALGVSLILSGRRWWRAGAVTALAGLGWLFLLGAFHATQGSPPSTYDALLAGDNQSLSQNSSSMVVVEAVLKHPATALSELWNARTNFFATLSPSGVIGILWLPLLVPIAMVLVEGGLTGSANFTQPGVQNVAAMPLVAVGTIAICAALITTGLGRKRWVRIGVFGVMVVNTLVWAAIWVPQIPNRWLTVSSDTGSVLRRVQTKIGPNDEVIADNGVVGEFANRTYVYPIVGSTLQDPIHTSRVWFIFAPTQGIESATVADTYTQMAAIAAYPHMRLVTASDGVWAFEWRAPKGTQSVYVDGAKNAVAPTWALAGVGGSANDTGSHTDWHVTSNGQPGYVIDHAYWRELPGTYAANVSLSASTPTNAQTNVELWNTTTGALLSRKVVGNTDGRVTVHLRGDLSSVSPEPLYRGFGAWRIVPLPAPRGDELEIRVWSPGGKDRVSIYSAGIHRIGNPS
jgi:hypothetical protein